MAAVLDDLNERLLARLNGTGEVFLSHTRLRGRYVIRVAFGNLRTEQRHVERLWTLIREGGAALDAEIGARPTGTSPEGEASVATRP